MATETKQLQNSAIDQQVLEIVRELLTELGKDQAAARLGLHSSFERELGLASLDLVELLVRCEARFEVKLPDETAEEADTPAGWVRAIQRGGEQAANKPSYRIRQPYRDAPSPPRTAKSLL